jgi:hypothetical protein
MSTPSAFESAVATLLAALPERDSELLKKASNFDLSMQHLGMGAWVRNNLGLWGDHSALKDEMRAHGINDEDAMSHFIIAGARAVLNGRAAESALSEDIDSAE